MPTPRPRKAPLFRKSEKLLIVTAVALLTATVLASTVIAGGAAEPYEALSQTFVSDLQEQGFNPQPEPPVGATGFVNPGSQRGFNPQPEPPGRLQIIRR